MDTYNPMMLNEIKKKVIQSLLYSNYQVITYAYCRMYSCSLNSKNWLFSNIEGILTLAIKTSTKALYFFIHDMNSFEIYLECELYKNINSQYFENTENFHYFEVKGGFIGFEFASSTEAQNLLREIRTLNDSEIASRIKQDKLINVQSAGINNISLLKQKFYQDGFYQEHQIQSNLEISQGELIEFIDCVEFDESQNKFIFNKNDNNGLDNQIKHLKGINFDLKDNAGISSTNGFAELLSQNIWNNLKKNLLEEKPLVAEEENEEETQAEQTTSLKSGTGTEVEDKKKQAEEKKRLEKERKEQEKLQKQASNTEVKMAPAPKPGKGGVPLPPPVPVPKIVPVKPVEAPAKNVKSEKPIDLAAELAQKKQGLQKVEVKEYVSPALKKAGEGGNSGADDSMSNSNPMMAQIMKMRQKMGGAPNQTQPTNVPAPIKPNPAPQMNQQMNSGTQNRPPMGMMGMGMMGGPRPQAPKREPPKPVDSGPKINPNVPPPKMGKGGIPVPPPIPKIQPIKPVVQPVSAPKKKEKPIDLAAELAQKKKGLQKVEVKEYVSPALKKTGEGESAGSSSTSSTGGGNDVRSQLLAQFQRRGNFDFSKFG